MLNASKLRGRRSPEKKQIKTNDVIFGMYNSFTRKYHCPRCDKTFKDKSGLSRHYQGHTGNYSYWCELCKKGFVVKSHYEGHLAKHE